MSEITQLEQIIENQIALFNLVGALFYRVTGLKIKEQSGNLGCRSVGEVGGFNGGLAGCSGL